MCGGVFCVWCKAFGSSQWLHPCPLSPFLLIFRVPPVFSVCGGAYAGGLAGVNTGTIAASYSTASANGGAGILDFIGGLVGRNNAGTIAASYATGAVSNAGQQQGRQFNWTKPWHSNRKLWVRRSGRHWRHSKRGKSINRRRSCRRQHQRRQHMAHKRLGFWYQQPVSTAQVGNRI